MKKLDKIEIIDKYKIFQIREITDSGRYSRRILSPDMTLAEDEHQEIQDKAEELWTDEVKASWKKFQAEQEKQLNPE